MTITFDLNDHDSRLLNDYKLSAGQEDLTDDQFARELVLDALFEHRNSRESDGAI